MSSGDLVTFQAIHWYRELLAGRITLEEYRRSPSKILITRARRRTTRERRQNRQIVMLLRFCLRWFE